MMMEAELDISLMAYDTDTGKIETVLPDVYNSYMVTGTDLYYRKSGEIYHYSMEDGTGEALMQISDSAEFLCGRGPDLCVGDSLTANAWSMTRPEIISGRQAPATA